MDAETWGEVESHLSFGFDGHALLLMKNCLPKTLILISQQLILNLKASKSSL
jgi:hypothetical protein